MQPASPISFSIVTPSYNQGPFLEAAIGSVLGQCYPALEYIIMDGGSTDGSVETIRGYAPQLAFWTSAPDGGHYPAVNAGFARSSGEVMAWLNADDQYLPWTFSVVAEVFAQFSEVEWLTTRWPLRWDRRGRAVRCAARGGFARAAFLRGAYAPGADRAVIQQESTFWRRSLWEKAGGQLDCSYPLAADFELWARFFKLTELYAIDTPLGGFRVHGEQRSALQRQAYAEDVRRALHQHGGRLHRPLDRLLARRAKASVVRFNKNSERWQIETVKV